MVEKTLPDVAINRITRPRITSMDTMRFLVTTSDCVRAVSEVPDAAVERLIEITPL